MEVVGLKATELAEPVADVGIGTVEPFGDGIDLGAVTRAEHHGLADVRAANQAGDGLAQGLALQRHPLEEVDGAGAVVDTDDHDAHSSASLCARGPRW